MIVLDTGDKGGTGKSIVCRFTVDYFIGRNENPLVIDTDTSNPDVARSYLNADKSGKNCEVLALNTDTEAGFTRLLDVILSTSASQRPVVINCGARDQIGKATFGPAIDALCRDEKLDLVVLWTLDAKQICVEQLRKFLANVAHKTAIIKNLGMVDDDPARFDFFSETKISKKLPSIFFPRLTNATIMALDTPRCHAVHELNDALTMGERYMARRRIETARSAIAEALQVATLYQAAD